jgi:hypothetical protein
MIFKTGDRVMIGYAGSQVEGVVKLASENGKSLALVFDAMLGGYVGMMPVLQGDDGVFRDLIQQEPVLVLVVTGARS